MRTGALIESFVVPVAKVTDMLLFEAVDFLDTRNFKHSVV